LLADTQLVADAALRALQQIPGSTVDRRSGASWRRPCRRFDRRPGTGGTRTPPAEAGRARWPEP
jgi:hypothetical protein